MLPPTHTFRRFNRGPNGQGTAGLRSRTPPSPLLLRGSSMGWRHKNQVMGWHWDTAGPQMPPLEPPSSRVFPTLVGRWRTDHHRRILKTPRGATIQHVVSAGLPVREEKKKCVLVGFKAHFLPTSREKSGVTSPLPVMRLWYNRKKLKTTLDGVPPRHRRNPQPQTTLYSTATKYYPPLQAPVDQIILK